MRYWEWVIFTITILFLFIKLVQLCCLARSKKQENEEQEDHNCSDSTIYFVEDEFFMIDIVSEENIQSTPPAYSEIYSVFEPPPPYEAPPEYTQITVRS